MNKKKKTDVERIGFEDWMRKATQSELKDFLEFCANATTFPSSASLSNFNLENTKQQELRMLANYLVDTTSKSDIYDLFVNLVNLIDEFKDLDDSGDCGCDIITAKVHKAIQWLEDMKTKVKGNENA